LREGRVYGSAPAGIVRLTNRTSDGIEHHFAVTVPDGYDPTHRYRVRIQLHGGVGMRRDSTPPPNAGGIGALEGDEPQFYIVPFAWDQAPWWSSDQLLNLRDILDQVKRRYNVDENHVVLSGVSDGGTGTYYTAMRDTTAFAAFLPLNGFWGVLAAPDLDVDGPLFPGNLRDKPFFIVNGERDPLYPIALVEPAVAHYRAIGMSLEYWPQAGAGHNTQWWPRVKPRFEDFVRAHPRRPLPDRLTWETADTKIFNRAHWLVVDALGAARGEQILDDPNLVASAPRLEFGVRSIGNRVNAVVPGSNAEQFGLKVGDALVRVNDESVHVSIDIEELFERVKPGTAMTLLVARDNAPVELSGTFNPKSVNDPPHEMFPRGQPSGRVDISRTGNTVTAKTHGVTAFTLLVSPDQFDFAKPIVVVANGTTVFNHRVDPSLATLLQWAAVDNDRTMLFGAEVHITLPRH
jgi:pimeloyl-ACP methyl ester carboxylesterase